MTITAEAPPVPFKDTKCGGCTALCCRYFALEIDTPDEPDDFENLRWYLIHEDVNLFIDEGDWYLQIFRKCTWLGEDNACTRYEDRPSICREYSDDWCDLDGANDGDVTFRTIEELEAYRDKWVADYEAKEKKKRKKKARKAKQKAKGRR
jgi:Fe-S-cluster containining protein